MTDPLPPELEDLVAAERAAPAPDAAARAAARARLAAAVGHAAPGAAGAFGAGKLLAILAVVVAAGTFAVLHGRGESHARPAAPTVASTMPVIAPTPTPAPTATTATDAPEPAQTAEGSAAKNTKNAKKASSLGALDVLGGQSLRSSTTATRSTPSTPSPSTPPTASMQSMAEPSHVQPAAAPPSPPPAEPADATTQAELIRQAWSALAVGEPDRALAIVLEDARLHDGGALDEERDAVRIVALARLGRLDEARRAATQFDHDYPTSLHHDLVTRALAGGADHDR
jgi:hypothetical protein